MGSTTLEHVILIGCPNGLPTAHFARAVSQSFACCKERSYYSSRKVPTVQSYHSILNKVAKHKLRNAGVSVRHLSCSFAFLRQFRDAV